MTVSVSCALKENVLQILVEEYDWLTIPQVKSNNDLTVTVTGSFSPSKHVCITNLFGPHWIEQNRLFPFYLLFLVILWNCGQYLTHPITCFRGQTFDQDN